MHSIKKVDSLNNYELKLTFEDGTIKSFDMEPYIENDSLIFRPLKQKDIFKMYSIKWNTVSWITWADISPDFLYEKWKIIK